MVSSIMLEEVSRLDRRTERSALTVRTLAGPVHMTSGTASLVWSYYLGKRRGYGTAKLSYRPHSVSHVVLGTTLLWL